MYYVITKRGEVSQILNFGYEGGGVLRGCAYVNIVWINPKTCLHNKWMIPCELHLILTGGFPYSLQYSRGL